MAVHVGGRGPGHLVRVGGFYPDADLALEFTTSRYRVGKGGYFSSVFSGLPGLTVTRASVGYAETSSGQLVQFAANVPRITDKGLLVEESRTNKCTNTNVNPSALTNMTLTNATNGLATLTLVNDSAELARIGLSGNVFKLDNSLGDSAAFATAGGTTGNTNVHAISAYARGNGLLRSSRPSGLGSTTVNSSTYARYSFTFTPDATTAAWQMQASPGQVVYFILNQLEEGSSVTSPIPVAGASATRAADSISISGLSLSVPFTWVAEWELQGLGSTGFPGFVAIDDGTNNNRVIAYRDNAAGLLYRQGLFGGASQGSISTGSVTANSVQKLAAREAANDMAVSRNGGAVATDTTISYAALSRVLLGATGAASEGNAYMRRLVIYPASRTNAELQTLATQ